MMTILFTMLSIFATVTVCRSSNSSRSSSSRIKLFSLLLVPLFSCIFKKNCAQKKQTKHMPNAKLANVIQVRVRVCYMLSMQQQQVFSVRVKVVHHMIMMARGKRVNLSMCVCLGLGVFVDM